MSKNYCKIYPKRNYLTVRQIPLGQTAGGIILPEVSKDSFRYIVEDVSVDVEMGVKPGDEVLTLRKGSAVEIVENADPDLYFIQECDIIAVIERA